MRDRVKMLYKLLSDNGSLTATNGGDGVEVARVPGAFKQSRKNGQAV